MDQPETHLNFLQFFHLLEYVMRFADHKKSEFIVNYNEQHLLALGNTTTFERVNF